MTRQAKIGLAIVLNALIWGYSLLSVFQPRSSIVQSQENNEKGDRPIESNKHPIPKDFRYDPAGIVDPFGGYADIEPFLKQPDEKAKEAVPKFSSLKLTGIVYDSQKPLAIVHTPDGKAHTVKEGDWVLGERILKIEEDKILVEKKIGPKVFYFELKMGSQTKLDAKPKVD